MTEWWIVGGILPLLELFHFILVIKYSVDKREGEEAEAWSTCLSQVESAWTLQISANTFGYNKSDERPILLKNFKPTLFITPVSRPGFQPKHCFLGGGVRFPLQFSSSPTAVI